MKILKNLAGLFYPDLCASCKEILIENEFSVCTICRHDLPITNFLDYKNNKAYHAFFGKITIEKAYALLFFRSEGITKNIIHDLKYKGNQSVGIFLGNWLGEILNENQEFNDIDFIIPVPLHAKKLKLRGYNQLTKFGNRLSFHLNKPFITNKLLRISSSKTQTFKKRFERFSNSNSKFIIKDPHFFNNKHVLLIDDVLTTGATLEACGTAFLKHTKCKLSMLTMAYTV